MKIRSLVLTSLALPVVLGSAQAATIASATYNANSTFTDNEGRVQSTTATWTINPGVTVEATSGRFFIGAQEAPNGPDAIFEVTGGGTLLISNTDFYTMRLDQNADAENGVLRILGGSTVNFTGNQGPWNGEATSSSRIELSGLGSTLMAEGTFNSTTNLYNRGGTAGEALPISATGVGESLNVSYNAGTNVTTFTVVPEPSIALMGALGALGLLRRRR